MRKKFFLFIILITAKISFLLDIYCPICGMKYKFNEFLSMDKCKNCDFRFNKIKQEIVNFVLVNLRKQGKIICTTDEIIVNDVKYLNLVNGASKYLKLKVKIKDKTNQNADNKKVIYLDYDYKLLKISQYYFLEGKYALVEKTLSLVKQKSLSMYKLLIKALLAQDKTKKAIIVLKEALKFYKDDIFLKQTYNFLVKGVQKDEGIK